MGAQLVTDAVERSSFKINFRLSVAFEASIGLQKVRLELSTKVYHVCTQTVKTVFLSCDCTVEDFLSFADHRSEEKLFFCCILLTAEIFKDVGDE
jgi:hypothetical protein